MFRMIGFFIFGIFTEQMLTLERWIRKYNRWAINKATQELEYLQNEKGIDIEKILKDS